MKTDVGIIDPIKGRLSEYRVQQTVHVEGLM